METAPPLIELRRVSKRFVRRLDLVATVAQRLGANLREEVVHAVEEVDLAVAEGAARRQAQLAVQMIFQDPYASLNPRLRVREIIGEAPQVHGLVERRAVDSY